MNIENIVVKVIAGGRDYRNGVKTYNELKSSPDSMHTSKTFESSISYEKNSQFKYYVALHQLVQLDMMCAFCGTEINKLDRVVLSHNMGHGDNLRNNGDNGKISRESLIENHYKFSIFHAGCNRKHYALGDKFESLLMHDKLKAMRLCINATKDPHYELTTSIFSALIPDKELVQLVCGRLSRK